MITAKVILVALAIVALIEGFVPFAVPAAWIRMVREVGAKASETVVRRVGFALLAFGTGVLWWLY